MFWTSSGSQNERGLIATSVKLLPQKDVEGSLRSCRSLEFSQSTTGLVFPLNPRAREHGNDCVCAQRAGRAAGDQEQGSIG